MGLHLLDRLTPFSTPRLPRFLSGVGDDHTYMVHIGAGFAMARIPFGLDRALSRLHPVRRGLALDGYGFHQGFFHWRRTLEGPREVPRRIRGYGRRLYDNGLGRSLWFVDGGDVERIPATIAGFPQQRRGDLWAGVGLDAAYEVWRRRMQDTLGGHFAEPPLARSA